MKKTRTSQPDMSPQTSLSRWITLLRQVTEIARDAQSSTAAFQQCLQLFCDSINCTAGHVYTVDTESGVYASSDIWVSPNTPLPQQIITSTLHRVDFQASATAKPGRSELILTREAARNDQRKQLLLDHGFAATIELPVNVQGTTVALIELFFTEAPARGAELLEVLDQAALQLGQLFERQYAQQHPTAPGGETYDISENALTRHALSGSEHRFETLFNDTPTIFFLLDTSGEILAVNEFGANYLGYNVDDLTGNDFLSIVYQADRPATRKEINKCINRPGKVHRWQLRQCTESEDTIWLRISGRAIRNPDGSLELLMVAEDINETQRLSEELQHQATHDALTGIINRKEFERQATELLQTPGDDFQHALCYLDLDQFKVINDACGHIAGDELLRQLTDVFATRVRASDTIGRLGGDEFGILMRNCSMEQADRVAEQIRSLVESYRFTWDDKPFSLGVSIGLVPITAATGTFEELLSAADIACYAAKDAGRNRVHIYHAHDEDLSKRRSEMDWVSKINLAVEDNRMLIYMQPIMQLADTPRQGDHYELLVRMIDDNGAIIPPGAFLPAAERYDLGSKIDLWVISTAFDWFSSQPDKIKRLAQCNINLSGQSIANPQFLDIVLDKLDKTRLPAEKLCFEITETAAIQNLAVASSFMQTLQQKGCKFALDDFGSGLSSFSYLKQFPVDFLKIDGSFVKEMVNDPIDFAMVQSINDIGHVMGKQTVAEFVEDNDILNALRSIGVDYAQGYGVGKPVPFILPPSPHKLAS